MELFFRTFGNGQPFIILHGLYGMSDNWVTHAKKLAEKYKVIIPDMRNHGFSAQSKIFNYDAMADDIGELIATQHLDNPIILGHSMGGKVAMRFVTDNPTHVAKLIVVDMSMREYKLKDFHIQLMYAMMDINFSQIKSRKEVEDILGKTIVDQRILLFIMKNLYRKENENFSWKLNLPVIFDNLEAILEEIKCNQIYHNPALFIRGENSDYISDADFIKIKHYFPDANLKTVPDAGHWVQADQPAIFMNILQEFLSK
ncbi:MAG: alpha/beta fold hydrolase [Bacteroidetes bacterium]|nr:alpha/beta fold hydrolase [Bacteroidota bacterium]